MDTTLFLTLFLFAIQIIAGLIPILWSEPSYVWITRSIFWTSGLFAVVCLVVWINTMIAIPPNYIIALGLFVAAGGFAWQQIVEPKVSQNVGGLPAENSGPIQWVHNLWMTGGAPKVFAMSFRGANITKDHAIKLIDAKIISLIDGTLMPLEVVAVDENGDNRTVPLEKIQLVPPGAPIELVAKFGGTDSEGRIMGVDAKPFLEKWRQFAFVAADDKRSYRMEFNENVMAVFFQGKIGPRIAVKPD